MDSGRLQHFHLRHSSGTAEGRERNRIGLALDETFDDRLDRARKELPVVHLQCEVVASGELCPIASD